MRKALSIFAFLLAGACLLTAQDRGIREALAEFRAPGDSTRTKLWWFHGETPTTREGITADLEAFKAAGIGGVVYYDQVHGPAEGAFDAFSPAWWEMLRFSALEAKRLGLSFEINLSNGYVAGGPWITPETGMQRLCSSDTLLQGGRRFRGSLAAPSAQDWWRDVAVLAFPVQPGDWTEYSLDSLSLHVPDTGFKARSISYTAPKARKSRNGAMNYPDGPRPEFYGMNFEAYGLVGILECSDDGRNWRKVAELPRPGGASGLAERTIVFPEQEAPYWRIRDAAEKLSGVRLSARMRIDRWQEKANYFSEFHDAGTPVSYGRETPPGQVQDLTSRMRADGTLDWEVPACTWVVMRIGAESTRGAIKHGRRNLMGLECDKMSREAARLQFASYAGRILDTLARIGAKPAGVCMDSHEAGPQNWTPDFPRIFRERNGYDLLPWLPAMRGYTVGSAAESEAFLETLRRTIADAVTENYYGELDRLCREAGVRFTAQATGNGLSLGADNISAKRAVDKPQGEFWARDIHGSYDIVDCASAAHLYGKPIASGEAFTDAKYSDSPATLKKLADFAYSRLINEFVVCASAYQPRLDEVPGNVANGRQYCLNRNNTIWPYSRPFWDYQARCAALLRQGEPVVDLLVYLGDDPPVKTLAHLLPVIPEGYNFDTTAADGLRGAVVESEADGSAVLRLPGGMRYRMLVIQRNVRPDKSFIERLTAWQEAGLPVYDAAAAGSIYDPVPVPFAPDLCFRSAAKLDDCVRFGHRRLSDADVYFVYNHSGKPFSQELSVRSPFRRIYRLDPLDASLVFLGEGPSFRLDLSPDESAFLLAVDADLSAECTQPVPGRRGRRLRGAWQLHFDPAMGGPDAPVRFRRLKDWTRQKDPRIRFYSGAAVYTKAFRWKPGRRAGRQYLQLEGLEWMARVYVNGREAGTVWCSPWRLDITDFLQPGRNELRLEVVNSLYNRMIGDAVEHPDGEGAITVSSYPLVDAETPLVPSGLRGVRILR
ncbi:MAG: glycosyl hydrolase family 2 [Bacteroidales bacterium]|nr:glycosyl hydrolase family 2 [Bacteroidales bacterium]